MIRYKSGIMDSLKSKGYSSSKLREQKIFGEKTMTDFRKCAPIPYKTLDKLCQLLDCGIGDLIEYVPDDVERDAASPTRRGRGGDDGQGVNVHE